MINGSILDLPGSRAQLNPNLLVAGIGRAHLSQIENGTVAARIDTLYALARAFCGKVKITKNLGCATRHPIVLGWLDMGNPP
jgi:hypothetical protein